MTNTVPAKWTAVRSLTLATVIDARDAPKLDSSLLANWVRIAYGDVEGARAQSLPGPLVQELYPEVANLGPAMKEINSLYTTASNHADEETIQFFVGFAEIFLQGTGGLPAPWSYLQPWLRTTPGFAQLFLNIQDEAKRNDFTGMAAGIAILALMLTLHYVEDESLHRSLTPYLPMVNQALEVLKFPPLVYSALRIPGQ